MSTGKQAMHGDQEKGRGDFVGMEVPLVTKKLSDADKEIVRIVGQGLQEMGLPLASKALMEESGCKLEHSTTIELRRYIFEGNWDLAVKTLNKMKDLMKDKTNLQKMLFMVYQQKYLELIESNDYLKALNCLRDELSELNIYKNRVNELPTFLMIKNKDELRKAANWEGTGENSRRKLLTKIQNYLPMSVMMPPSRLKALFEQALCYQKSKCLFHNTPDAPKLGSCSLLLDQSDFNYRKSFPTRTTQILSKDTYDSSKENIDTEIWVCQFSHNGTTLATGSREGNVKLWSINQDTHEVSHKCTISSHNQGIGYLSWSPDNKWLLVCGGEDSSEIHLVNPQQGTLEKQIQCSGNDDSLTCCCWSSTKCPQSNDYRFVTGGLKGHFYECNLDGVVLGNWEGVRVQALAPYHTDDGSFKYLAADSQYRVRWYDFDNENNDDVLKEDHPILTMCTSQDGKYLLVNLVDQGINLWDLKDRVKTKKFQGNKQGGTYHIYSCFGGINHAYVASGSEDGQLYIWNRNKEKCIEELHGHNKVVNCVAWNPKINSMIASASDDGTIRIWGCPSESEPDSGEDGFGFKVNIEETSEESK